ncbi:hypothetical protein R1flu_004032 [Riccia fluitans]|uniref:Uncharacterized protein n=1 Tax=Riccia fluitans TaxID=41844 RepID=A0ABD1YP47_9MARC
MGDKILDYEPTILPDVPPMDNPTRPVTLDLSMDAREDPSSPPPSQIVPVPALVDLTQYASSPENEGSEDQGWPCKNDLTKFPTHDPKAIFHILKQVLCLIVPIDPALVMMGIMNVEQQQDGHSCGKHVLQMLVGAAKKESDGLDRCFREEGLRYIATLDQGTVPSQPPPYGRNRLAIGRPGAQSGRPGALRRPAAALYMATHRAASALRAPMAALLAAAVHAAAFLKRPQGRFRVREWERERVIHIALLDRASQLYLGEW